MSAAPQFIEVREEESNNVIVRIERIVTIAQNDDETARINYYDADNVEQSIDTTDKYYAIRAKLITLGLLDP